MTVQESRNPLILEMNEISRLVAEASAAPNSSIRADDLPERGRKSILSSPDREFLSPTQKDRFDIARRILEDYEAGLRDSQQLVDNTKAQVDALEAECKITLEQANEQVRLLENCGRAIAGLVTQCTGSRRSKSIDDVRSTRRQVSLESSGDVQRRKSTVSALSDAIALLDSEKSLLSTISSADHRLIADLVLDRLETLSQDESAASDLTYVLSRFKVSLVNCMTQSMGHHLQALDSQNVSVLGSSGQGSLSLASEGPIVDSMRHVLHRLRNAGIAEYDQVAQQCVLGIAQVRLPRLIKQVGSIRMPRDSRMDGLAFVCGAVLTLGVNVLSQELEFYESILGCSSEVDPAWSTNAAHTLDASIAQTIYSCLSGLIGKCTGLGSLAEVGEFLQFEVYSTTSVSAGIARLLPPGDLQMLRDLGTVTGALRASFPESSSMTLSVPTKLYAELIGRLGYRAQIFVRDELPVHTPSYDDPEFLRVYLSREPLDDLAAVKAVNELISKLSGLLSPDILHGIVMECISTVFDCVSQVCEAIENSDLSSLSLGAVVTSCPKPLLKALVEMINLYSLKRQLQVWVGSLKASVQSIELSAVPSSWSAMLSLEAIAPHVSDKTVDVTQHLENIVSTCFAALVSILGTCIDQKQSDEVEASVKLLVRNESALRAWFSHGIRMAAQKLSDRDIEPLLEFTERVFKNEASGTAATSEVKPFSNDGTSI